MNTTGSEALRDRFEKEQERLAKLWDAYELQEKDFGTAKDKIQALTRELDEKDRIIESLKDVAANRDTQLREMETRLSTLEREKRTFEPQMEEMKTELDKQKDQFSKLYKLSEELDKDLQTAKREIQARDDWFRENIQVFNALCNSIPSRERMVHEARELVPTFHSGDVADEIEVEDIEI